MAWGWGGSWGLTRSVAVRGFCLSKVLKRGLACRMGFVA